MNMRVCSGVAAFAAAMCCGSANAELTGIHVEGVPNGLSNLHTFQVVAQFDSSLDLVEAVFGQSFGNAHGRART